MATLSWKHFSLARALAAMSDGGLVGPSVERDLLTDYAERNGWALTPNRITLPFEALARRDLVASSSGYALVGTDSGAPVDALREGSVAIGRLGIPVLSNLRQNLTLPAASAAVAGSWLDTELDPVAAEQPTIAQVTLSPKHAAALTTVSHQLLRQSAVEDLLRASLTRSVGQLLDAAVLNGSGSSGVPLGILNTSGTNTQDIDGTACLADCLAAIQAIREDGGEPTAWVMSPASATILAGREAASGSGFILTNNQIAGVPVVVTNSMPASKYILGDWRHAVVGQWGGIEVMADPFSSFNDGRVSLRVRLACDFAMLHRTAFCTGALS